MIAEILRATILGALPVAGFSFLLVQWAVASGRLPRSTNDNYKTSVKKHAKEAKAAAKLSKQQRKISNKQASSSANSSSAADTNTEKKPFFRKPARFHKRAGGDFLYDKIVFFGGGFYGTMALLCYVIIEAIEIWGFLNTLAAPDTWANKLGFGLLIDFIIGSITNIVSAFLWFSTLPDFLPISSGFTWLVAAYLGYQAGTRISRLYGDALWQKMGFSLNIQEPSAPSEAEQSNPE